MKKAIVLSTIIIFMNSILLLADCSNRLKTNFILNEDKVFDKNTKLTWFRCSLGTNWKDSVGCEGTPKLFYFNEALEDVKQISNGWRLPTINELRSITEEEYENTIINTSVFPDIKNMTVFAPYWSSTHVENMPNLIYYIDFIDNRLDAHSKGYSMFVRLVKSVNK